MQSEMFKQEQKVKIPFSKGVLKSAVQKAIRRGAADKAVRCAKSLMELDELDTLRRSMIWPIEDVMVHPGYDDLARLTSMLSSKSKRPLTVEDKTKVLSVVSDLANCEYRDLDLKNPEDPGKEASMHPISGGKENDLVNAIIYRSRIGGMIDDRWMLEKVARVWNRRFAEGSWTANDIKQYFTGEVIDWNDVPYAELSDILLDSIDMHTDPPIPYKLLKKPYIKDLLHELIPLNKRDWAFSTWEEGSQTDEGILKKVIWCMRSSYSPKKNIWMEPPRAITYLWAMDMPEEVWEPFERLYELMKPEIDSYAEFKLERQWNNR